MTPSKNPVDTIRDVIEPIARDHGLEIDEEAMQKARDYCAEVAPGKDSEVQ